MLQLDCGIELPQESDTAVRVISLGFEMFQIWNICDLHVYRSFRNVPDLEHFVLLAPPRDFLACRAGWRSSELFRCDMHVASARITLNWNISLCRTMTILAKSGFDLEHFDFTSFVSATA